MANSPDYWIRQRAGESVGSRVEAAEAAELAAQEGVIGDHMSQRGIVWREPDAASYTGEVFVTLTPVWERQRRADVL